MARPKIEDTLKVRKDGLLESQYTQLKREAASRKLPVAYVLREAVSWYLSAKEAARLGSVATKEDDIDFERLQEEVNRLKKQNEVNSKSNKTQNRKGK